MFSYCFPSPILYGRHSTAHLFPLVLSSFVQLHCIVFARLHTRQPGSVGLPECAWLCQQPADIRRDLKRCGEMWRDVENKDERKQTHYELQKRTANSRESQRGNENQTAPPCVFWMPQLWHLVVLKDKMIQNVCLILSVESSSAII